MNIGVRGQERLASLKFYSLLSQTLLLLLCTWSRFFSVVKFCGLTLHAALVCGLCGLWIYYIVAQDLLSCFEWDIFV